MTGTRAYASPNAHIASRQATSVHFLAAQVVSVILACVLGGFSLGQVGGLLQVWAGSHCARPATQGGMHIAADECALLHVLHLRQCATAAALAPHTACRPCRTWPPSSRAAWQPPACLG